MILKIFKRILQGLLVLVVLLGIYLVTPRLWSSLHPGKPPVGYHFVYPVYLALWLGIEDTVRLTPEIPDDIQEIKNIEYKNVDGKSLQLDMYIPKTVVKPAPLLVFIHGGGWRSGKRSDYLIYLVDFAKRGYITATVTYRLVKEAPYPACAEDIRDAVQWFFRNGETYGYNPDRIALVGGSAGGHLSMLGGYEWEKPQHDPDTIPVQKNRRRIKAVVDIYGPVDLTTEYARNHSLVTRFIAKPWEDAPELYREASPIRYTDKSDPPTLILHGTSDDLVPVSQSDMLKARLDSLGVPCVYYRFPLWPHTMDVVKRVNVFSQLKMNEFFEEYLK